jgi:hypothetical protein
MLEYYLAGLLFDKDYLVMFVNKTRKQTLCRTVIAVWLLAGWLARLKI